MNVLSLDIGNKRTGAAVYQSDIGIVMPLPTIEHDSHDQLIEEVEGICNHRSINHIIIGLPLLPSGEEGEQASVVRLVYKDMEKKLSISLTLLDERYSNPRGQQIVDDNIIAACNLLRTWLQRQGISS